jgi:hypothetical protein
VVAVFALPVILTSKDVPQATGTPCALKYTGSFEEPTAVVLLKRDEFFAVSLTPSLPFNYV